MNTPITTIELGKLIGQEPTNIRRKAMAMNGVINFDRDVDAFSAEQLRRFLPEYLKGNRPLKGEKRRAVEQLLSEVGAPINSQAPTPLKPINKPVNAPINKSTKPVNSRERLEDTGVSITVWLGSLPVLYAYFFLFIASEAVIQADLLSRSTGLPIGYLVAGTFATLMLLVLLTINAKFDDSRVIQWEVFENGEFTKKGISSGVVAEIVFWFYNVLMCEARFFLEGGKPVFTCVILAAAGIAIPSVIAMCSRMLKNRIKNLKI